MKAVSKNLEISNKTKGALPRVPFADLKKEILGDDYELSICFVGKAKMKSLSEQYKGDGTHMNVLSFPLQKNSGEIIMNFETIKKEAADFTHSPKKHLIFIVIHGMLHLAGHTHGSKMESEEKRLMKKHAF